MRKNNRTKYSTQQWRTLFSTLFISTTLVLILLLIAINLQFSSKNITQSIITEQTLIVSLQANLEPLDKIVLQREVGKLKWVSSTTMTDNQLIIILKQPLESIESISEDLAQIAPIKNIAYPRLLNNKTQLLANNINKLTTLLLIATAIICWIFSFLILKSLLYSKRQQIYYMKLVGCSKGYLLKKYSTIVFWCSLAAALAAIIIVSGAMFIISLIDTSSVTYININGLFIGLTIIPLWAAGMNSINCYYIISKIYKLNKKQIYSI